MRPYIDVLSLAGTAFSFPFSGVEQWQPKTTHLFKYRRTKPLYLPVGYGRGGGERGISPRRKSIAGTPQRGQKVRFLAYIGIDVDACRCPIIGHLQPIYAASICSGGACNAPLR